MGPPDLIALTRLTFGLIHPPTMVFSRSTHESRNFYRLPITARKSICHGLHKFQSIDCRLLYPTRCSRAHAISSKSLRKNSMLPITSSDFPIHETVNLY